MHSLRQEKAGLGRNRARVDAQKRANQRVLALLMEQASLTQENLQLMEVCQVADPRCPATGMRLSLLCSLILL